MSSWPSYLPDLLGGLLVSLKLTAASLAVGLPFGLLLAVIVQRGGRPLRAAALLVIEVGRGAPALVLLSLIYFGLPQAELTFSAFLSAVIALGWAVGAYTSEIFRASLEAVPRGQREAAAASGLSGLDEFRFIILPQAIRIAIPPLMSICISVFQATSLAFAIGLPELMSVANIKASANFDYLSVFTLAALIYAVICIPSSALVGLVERRLSRSV
jgi:polar amino acid transport system permease protein